VRGGDVGKRVRVAAPVLVARPESARHASRRAPAAYLSFSGRAR
jgi:hypothetical protein